MGGLGSCPLVHQGHHSTARRHAQHLSSLATNNTCHAFVNDVYGLFRRCLGPTGPILVAFDGWAKGGYFYPKGTHPLSAKSTIHIGLDEAYTLTMGGYMHNHLATGCLPAPGPIGKIWGVSPRPPSHLSSVVQVTSAPTKSRNDAVIGYCSG